MPVRHVQPGDLLDDMKAELREPGGKDILLSWIVAATDFTEIGVIPLGAAPICLGVRAARRTRQHHGDTTHRDRLGLCRGMVSIGGNHYLSCPPSGRSSCRRRRSSS